MIRGARHTDRSPHKSIYAATGRPSPVRSLHRHLEAQLYHPSTLRNETDTGGGEAILEQGPPEIRVRHSWSIPLARSMATKA